MWTIPLRSWELHIYQNIFKKIFFNIKKTNFVNRFDFRIVWVDLAYFNLTFFWNKKEKESTLISTSAFMEGASLALISSVLLILGSQIYNIFSTPIARSAKKANSLKIYFFWSNCSDTKNLDLSRSPYIECSSNPMESNIQHIFNIFSKTNWNVFIGISKSAKI